MVTWSTLAALIALLAGIAVAGFGALWVFATGMASNPDAHKDEARKGCICFFVGLAIFVGAGGHLVGWWVLPILPA